MKKQLLIYIFLIIICALYADSIFSSATEFFSNIFRKNPVKGENSWLMYEFNGNGRANTVKWQCFPTLDTETTGGTIVDNVLEDMMAAESPDLPQLETLQYKENEDAEATVMNYIINNEAWHNNNFEMSRTRGYKFKFRGVPTEDIELEISGFQIEEDTAIPLLGIELGGRSTVIEHENWIGYIVEESQEWDDAFGASLDNMYYIQTQDWAMVREKREPGARWIGVSGKDYTLSYGDMVIVKCFDDDSGFTWNTGSASTPVAPAKSTAFDYEEELDYIPVYVEFDAEDAPTEVAVLADGVCQGAALVEDGEAQICAYITNNTGETLELEYYYGERTANKTVKTLKVYNAETNSFISKSLKINPQTDYYRISLRDEQESVDEVPIVASLSNYPNPFNPTTSICYSVPEESKIELEIYNVKGQLVKTLVNGTSPAGEFKLTWQGVDNSGNRVGSGIYFSRLKIGKEVLNKKMVLLK